MIRLLDPNLLACPEREDILQQLSVSGAWIDFTQGLDIRLIDKDIIRLLNKIKIKRIYFAWDNPAEDLLPKFKLFNKYSDITHYSRRGVFILTNYNSTHVEDLMRIYAVRDLNYDPYIMIYNRDTAPKQTRQLQRWVNNRRIFRAVNTFEEYDHSRR